VYIFSKQVLQQRRQQVMELPDEAAQELLAEIEEDEEVPIVPAKLLNNTAVLLYRWAFGHLHQAWCGETS
jgi:hypothetical protein